MFMGSKSLLFFSLFLSTTVSANDLVPQLGKDGSAEAALPEWNLTISPDGKNLPIGKGTAAEGETIFANKCSGCHGPEGI